MNRRRGSVLVAVLLLAALLVVFVGVASERTQVASAAARSAAEDVAADMAVVGAVEQLWARTGGRLGEIGTIAEFTYPGLKVDVATADEARRIDLNLAAPELVAGIFRSVGVAARDADYYAKVIVDWRRDPKAAPTGSQRPTVAAHGVIEHVRQLDRIPQIPPEAIRRILPFVTVTSLQPRVAALTAPPQVIAALPGMDPDRVEAFLKERRESTDKFETLMKRYGIVLDHVSKEGSKATRLDLVVRIGSHRVRAYQLVVGVFPGDQEPYRILSWDGDAALPATPGG